MKVSDYLAQDIVESMKEIINQDINYIDTEGIIIASTDQMRIGTFHGGSKKVLVSQQEVVINLDGQFEGAKQGVNLPVYFEKMIVGVIGITGKKEEVEKFGKVIQKMTEILIKEAYVQEQEKIERESKKQFIEELLFRMYKEDQKTIKMRADLLNIKIDIPRIIIISRVWENYESELLINPSIHEKIYNFIKSYIDYNQQNLVIQSGMNSIIILDAHSLNKVDSLFENIHNNFKNKYNLEICFGIGCISNNAEEMRHSYTEAKKALSLAIKSKEKFILHYSDLDLGLIVEDLPEATKKKFTDKVFANMTPKQIEVNMKIFKKYIEKNGSITKASEELFLHKNTLQYKLNKIKTVTGYDPRNMQDMVVLYLADLLRKNNE